MKKNVFAGLLIGLAALLAFSCKSNEDEPVLPGTGVYTLQLTVPSETPADDAIYLVGALSGGEELSIGNPVWALRRAADASWTIQLDSKNFIGGKTLADGFYFYSQAGGAEVDAAGAAVSRSLDARDGESYTLTVVAWSKQEEPGPSFDPSGVWTVVGSFNDWNQKAGLPMEVRGNARVAQAVTLSATDEFKFVMDGSWDSNFGAGEPGSKTLVTAEEPFSLLADGGNIQIAAGTYDIYLYPFEARALLKASEPEDKPVEVSGISLNPTSLTLKVGESARLTARVEPEDATDKSVSWSTENAAVAQVADGSVTAVAAGTTVITAQAGAFSASCTVTVEEEAEPIVEDGPTVYLYNGVGASSLYLYAWVDGLGDVDAAAWPGLPVTEQETVSGHNFSRLQLNTNWSSGEINLIVNDGGNGFETPSYPISMNAGSSYYFHVSATGLLAIDPATFDPEPAEETSEYSLIGWHAADSWTTNVPLVAVSGQSGWYVAASIGAREGNIEFKFRKGEAWVPQISAAHDYAKQVNTKIALTVRSEESSADLPNIHLDGNGTYDVYFNEQLLLCFILDAGSSFAIPTADEQAPEKDPTASSWSIIGDAVGGWSNVNDVFFYDRTENYYVASGVTVSGGANFKFRKDQAWNEQLTQAGVRTVGERFDLVDGDGTGNDMQLAESGEYDFYLAKDLSHAVILRAGDSL